MSNSNLPTSGVCIEKEIADDFFKTHFGKICTSFEPVDFGYNNRSYLIECDDLSSYVLRLTGKHWSFTKTNAEVSTMLFLKENTTIPVPTVYKYDTSTSDLGFEYILMERMPGELLYHIWDDLDRSAKEEIVLDIAKNFIQIRKLKFDQIGCMVSPGELGICVDENAGPFSTEKEYIDFLLTKKISEIETNENYSPQRIYLEALDLIKRNLEEYTNFDFNDTFYFTHYDLDSRNIFVKDNKVSAFLDWEFAGSYPFHVEWNNSFDIIKDMTDSDHCRDIFYKELESNYIETPGSVSQWDERNKFYDFLDNIAPWVIAHKDSDDIEGKSIVFEECRVVIMSYLSELSIDNLVEK